MSTPTAFDRHLPQLFGREHELSLIDELLEHRDTRGAALLIRGEAGIGKSALLGEARRRAEALGMPVLGTSGAHFETQMPFAGLHRLLRPLLPGIDTLPAPQRDALAAAFGLSDRLAPDLFLIALAGLELLSDRAGETPLLLVVEDAQWLDSATCEVLAFIARRVELEPIVVLFAVRTDLPTGIDDVGLPELRVDPLDDESAATLLAAHAPELAPDLRARLLADAAGNPLALVELPRVLEDLDGLSETAPLPLTDRLERAFAGRASELPRETRLPLLVAALDEGAALREILDAASLVDDRSTTTEDIAVAESAGLISLDAQTVRFRHPLVRAAVYHASASSQRQAAHRALAQTHAADPDRCAWHRAEALIGPDDEVAADLEAAAERAVRRGAPAAAATALARAAQVSEGSAGRGRLLVRAAEIEVELGRTELALRRLAEAEPLELQPEDRMRLTFLHEAADQDSWSGPARVAAFAELANEMTSAGGPALLLRSLVPVAIGCWWGNPTQDTRDLLVDAAERLHAAEDDASLLAVLACADPRGRGKVVIDRIRGIAPDPARDPVELHLIGTAATAVWAFDVSWPFLVGAVNGLRAQGRLGLLAQALVSQTWAAIHLAKDTIAMSAADEGARLARETGQARWALAADLAKATIAGERGDFGTADALADQAEAELLPIGAQTVLSLVQFARGRCAVAHARHTEGLEQLTRMLDPSDVAYHPFTGAWALADLVDAASHAGRPDLATRYLGQLESLATQTSASYLRASAAYARPLVAADDEAEALYQTALERDLSNWPCFRGRLLLHYGRWLRRRRRVAESRAPLRAARECFDALAFDGLAETARQELRASGETSGQRTPDARDRLTPQELQIAQLAAGGLSNREIGQQLYLSHRTVGSHLYRIFPKLGIRSRSELGNVLSAHLVATPASR